MKQRLSIRVTPEIKSIIQEAADLLDQSLTDFVVDAAYTAAFKFTNSYALQWYAVQRKKEIMKELKDK